MSDEMFNKAMDKLKTGEHLELRNCSLCGFMMEIFLATDGNFYTDTACDCVRHGPNYTQIKEKIIREYANSEHFQKLWGLK